MNSLLQRGIVLITVVLIAACTKSSFALKTFYNNLDYFAEKRVNEYAAFTPEQKAIISDEVEQFHLWHRQNQLPEAANLLGDIELFIAQSETAPFNEADAELIINRARILYQKAFLASPIYQRVDFMRSISEQQIEQIKLKALELTNKRRIEHEKRTIDDQLESIDDMLSYLGLDLTRAQKEKIKSTLPEYQSGLAIQQQISNQWQQTFYQLLAQRDQADFEDKMQAHLASTLTMYDQGLYDIRKHNRAVTIKLVNQIMGDLSDKQRKSVSRRLQKLQGTLIELSEDS